MQTNSIISCLTNRGHLVVQENALVQDSYHKLSHFVSLILRFIISLIQPGDKPGKWYSIDCVALLALLRWTDFKYSRIENALETLSTAVWWHRTADEIQQMTGYIRYRPVSYSARHYDVQILPHCAKYLVDIRARVEAYRTYLQELQKARDEGVERDPSMPVPEEVYYTAYPMDSIAVMPHRYSHRLYELLKSHANRAQWMFEIGTGSEYDLLPLLAEVKIAQDGTFVVPKGWSNWSTFQRDILEPAKEDINTYSDITIEYYGYNRDIHHRQTRGIRSIKFDIKPKKPVDRTKTHQAIDALYNKYIEAAQNKQAARAEATRTRNAAGKVVVPITEDTATPAQAIANVSNNDFAPVNTVYSERELEDLFHEDENEYANLDEIYSELADRKDDDEDDDCDDYDDYDDCDDCDDCGDYEIYD